MRRVRRSWAVVVLLCATAGMLPGCARHARPREPAVERRSPEPETARTLIGYASFYGPGFAGETTASGDVFDPRDMVAAHRTLPFGTRVRVTNLANGRTVILTITDRGPYASRDTIIDVSQAAAKKLDFIRKGRTRVKVEVLDDRER